MRSWARVVLGLWSTFGCTGDGADTDADDDAVSQADSDDGAGDDRDDGAGNPEIPDDCVPDYACTPTAPDTGDFYADCVAQVNQFRACVCLPPLERKRDAEACLNEQAEYDSSHDPHAGFSEGICMPRGNAQNECPGWRDARQIVNGCLQSMFDEGPPPSADCDGQCYQEHGHFINMTSTQYTEVACGLYEAGGEVWSVQNFF